MCIKQLLNGYDGTDLDNNRTVGTKVKMEDNLKLQNVKMEEVTH